MDNQFRMNPEFEKIITGEKEKISSIYKDRLKHSAKHYQKLISKNSDNFEKSAKKLAKEHEAVYNVMIKDLSTKMKSQKMLKKHVTFPAIRQKIIYEICEYYGLNVDVVKTPGRKKRLTTDCIQTIYYFLYSNNLGTLECIGNDLNRTPEAVFSGINTVHKYLKVDHTFRRNFINIKERVEEVIKECYKNEENGGS